MALTSKYFESSELMFSVFFYIHVIKHVKRWHLMQPLPSPSHKSVQSNSSLIYFIDPFSYNDFCITKKATKDADNLQLNGRFLFSKMKLKLVFWILITVKNTSLYRSVRTCILQIYRHKQYILTKCPDIVL